MADETAPPPPARRDVPWMLLAGVFASLWVAYLLVAGPRRVDDLDAPGPGTAVDYEWSLQNLDGATVSFADFRGKALFVNVWATWCGPCIAEMPSIARLAAHPDLQDGKVAFVCIATDDEVQDVKRFVAGKGWPMTILHARALPPVFLTDGIPATFFVSPDGRLAYSRVGSSEWDAPEVVKKLRDMAATRVKADVAAPPRPPAA
ncbi:TlpA family protein disulfide reductase [Paludisphaera mucosa]|uniref:TlpA disulfide reductase family protein n=1 Tax=Paludisphaera mucosa TaxID=3030827 RepID=A0ABT6FGD4_9BACT|nr:TlpA disulfide reductase family protein [Paludisphaera mucosa]MDG3006460.1 TlpA disulfide reductase family protein [Paludisphaera mucosa]